MKYLLFVRNRVDGARIAADLGPDDQVEMVLPGPPSGGLEPQIHQFDPEDETAYQRLFETLETMPDRILHAWSWTATPASVADGDELDLDASLRFGVASAFLLAKAMIARKPAAVVSVLYVHARPDGRARPVHDAVGAFARTVAQESMKVKVKVVAFDGDGGMPLAEHLPVLIDEWTSHPEDHEVRYEGGRRLRRLLQEVPKDLPTAQTGVGAIRDGGVYLITGGAGGLGFIFARHLASRHRIHLVLCGRRPENEDITKRLEELSFLGADASYCAVDMADLTGVEAMITAIERRHGPLTGIIHASGINRDALITKKSLPDFQAVLRPKVQGTLALDRATLTAPLEIVVYFSSIAGLMGNIGQADYAYANAFMDSHAQLREHLRRAGKRSGRTIAINWPLWRDGGMGVDEEVGRFAERTLGMPPLTMEQGLALFDRALGLDLPRIFVGYGDRTRAGKWFGLGASAPASPATAPISTDRTPLAAAPARTPGTTAETKSGAVDDATVLNAIQTDLVNGVVEILELDPKDADMDTDLNQFGFDSLTFTTFGNRITEALKIDINPVVFFEYNTVRELSEYFFGEYRDTLIDWYHREKEPAAPAQASAQVMPASPPPSISPAAPPLMVPPPPAEQTRTGGSERPRSVASIPPEPVSYTDEPIAIIGIDGVLPQSPDLDVFWDHLSAGADLVTEIPADRWDWRTVWGDPFESKNHTQIKWGAFVPDVDKFDAAFFGISAREAERMDPQHRLFLQSVWHCMEDAGYRPNQLTDTSTVGLFCGSASVDYHDIMVRENIDVDVFAVTGTMFSVLVNRISYLMNFRGPSEPVETACSSSLVAVHRAMQSIRAGECDVAIAGGVHLMLGPSVHIGLDKGGFLSQQGRCATFDKDADGYVRGEGCVAVMLKPLSRALADGDPIHAKIIGSAVNHGGRVNTLTTPNPNAQTEVITKAWKQACVDPRTISYIEAHGTGTALGDPIEIKALSRAFDTLEDHWDRSAPELSSIPDSSGGKYCGIGSVKSNIGHLEFVAGISGLAKMVMAMHHETLPASIHFSEINPYINLDKSPLHIVDSRRPWVRPRLADGREAPLRTGISSFGFGGVNCHIALEEHLAAPASHPVPATGELPPVLLSARSAESLAKVAARLHARIERDPELDLSDVAWTLAVGRTPLPERLVILATDRQDLLARLSGDLETPIDGHLYRGNKTDGQKRLEFLTSSEKARHFAETVQTRGLTPEMAGYWVDGLDVDWAAAGLVKGRRVRLPGYPFEPTRHWIASGAPAMAPTDTVTVDGNVGTLEAEIQGMLEDGLLTEKQALDLLSA